MSSFIMKYETRPLTWATLMLAVSLTIERDLELLDICGSVRDASTRDFVFQTKNRNATSTQTMFI